MSTTTNKRRISSNLCSIMHELGVILNIPPRKNGTQFNNQESDMSLTCTPTTSSASRTKPGASTNIFSCFVQYDAWYHL